MKNVSVVERVNTRRIARRNKNIRRVVSLLFTMCLMVFVVILFVKNIELSTVNSNLEIKNYSLVNELQNKNIVLLKLEKEIHLKDDLIIEQDVSIDLYHVDIASFEELNKYLVQKNKILSDKLSLTPLGYIAYEAGKLKYDEEKIVTLVKIALAESGGEPLAVNTSNSNGTVDYGLFQINSMHNYDPNELLTVKGNVAIALDFYSQLGTQPWNSSKSKWGQ